MKTKQQKILAEARSLFERLQAERSTQQAVNQLKLILQNNELWEKVQKDLGLSAYA